MKALILVGGKCITYRLVTRLILDRHRLWYPSKTSNFDPTQTISGVLQQTNDPVNFFGCELVSSLLICSKTRHQIEALVKVGAIPLLIWVYIDTIILSHSGWCQRCCAGSQLQARSYGRPPRQAWRKIWHQDYLFSRDRALRHWCVVPSFFKIRNKKN